MQVCYTDQVNLINRMATYKITVGGTSIETSDLKSAATALFALARSNKTDDVQRVERIQVHQKPIGTGKHKPHKKHLHLKKCPECGEAHKGLKGLNIHRARAHGFIGRVRAWKNGKAEEVQPQLPF